MGWRKLAEHFGYIPDYVPGHGNAAGCRDVEQLAVDEFENLERGRSCAYSSRGACVTLSRMARNTPDSGQIARSMTSVSGNRHADYHRPGRR